MRSLTRPWRGMKRLERRSKVITDPQLLRHALHQRHLDAAVVAGGGDDAEQDDADADVRQVAAGTGEASGARAFCQDLEQVTGEGHGGEQHEEQVEAAGPPAEARGADRHGDRDGGAGPIGACGRRCAAPRRAAR